MNRRSFLAAVAAGPWVLGCAPRPPAQPNILVVIADDQSYVDVGCYGSREVATPNIDRLASEGMRFTRAFTATAMCAPMRQQMYTGIFPVRNGAYPNHSQIKPGIKTLPSYFQELGYRVGLAGKRHFGPAESFPFEQLGGKDLDFGAIEEFVRRDARQPYCLLVCSNQPHGPYNKGDAARHPPERLEIPPYWVDTPLTRQTLSAYYAECEYLDWEVGQCAEIVDRSEQAASTLTMYCSEQGCRFPFAKWTCYDLGLREAVVVRWPGRVAPGSETAAMVQGVDWLPTFLEAAGAAVPDGLDGRSALGVLEGRAQQHHQAVYGVHTTRGIINGSECFPIRSIRTETHKLILNLSPETKFSNAVTSEMNDSYWDSWVEKAATDEHARQVVNRYLWRPPVEFYDLAADPFEQNNLAEAPEHQGTIESQREQLAVWMEQQGDRGVATELLAWTHPRD